MINSCYEERVWRKKFGDKLKRLIHIRGMTQGQFAELLGIDESILSRYITGSYTPSSYRVYEIANLLECDVNCLYDVDN